MLPLQWPPRTWLASSTSRRLAAMISALLEGRDVAAAVRRGAWIGARAVQVLGDTEGLPTRAQLEAAGL